MPATTMWKILDPSAAPESEAQKRELAIAPRLRDLKGKTLGYLSNMWPSVRPTFQRFDELARQRQHTAGAIVKEHANAASAAPPEQFQELISKADAVVVGLAN